VPNPAELRPWVELAAALLAGWAVWRSLPVAVPRDWERLFKITLSAQLWAEAEGGPGDEAARTAAWAQALAAQVPFHPAGRLPERKLLDPGPAAAPAPALPGELGLVEALARLPTPAARYKALYVDSRAAQEALAEDPRALGPAYDPEPVIGAGADWEAVARWAPAVQAGLARKFGHVEIVVDLPAQSSAPAAALEEALRSAAPGLRVSRSPTQIFDVLRAPSDRLVVLTGGDRVLPWLRALADSPALRDRCLALTSVDGQITDADGADAFFPARWQHAAFEPELQRTTAFFSLTDVDPDHPERARWSGSRFPAPPLPAGQRPTIEPIDLGPAPVGALRPALLVRGLLVTWAARLHG
jgi:hypothetical protein